MSIADYLVQEKKTLRQMAEECGVHYSTVYRLSLVPSHPSSRNRISLDIANKIIAGTQGKVTLADLAKKP
jgi:hypothetical protein